MNKFIRVLSYVLTALLSCTITLVLMLVILQNGGMPKLQALEALINQCYIGEVDKAALEDGAAHGMINALPDRWSYYIPASDYEDYEDDKKNRYVGIGITAGSTDDGSGILVEDVAQGGPADKAGIQIGDVITQVNGESIAGKTQSQAGEMLQGEVGTQIALVVKRGDQSLSFTVTFDYVPVPVATGALLEGNIGLVTIKNFNANCFRDTKKVIEELLAQGAEKLLFDVRFNGGGYADEMVKLLDYLLPQEDQIFRTVAYNGREKIYKSDANCLNVPMAVLVNDCSYSAAEFFAAALQELKYGTVIGDKTVGKGYYQLVYTLADGSAVGLSVGQYFTPMNNNLEGIGLTPDIPVEVDDRTYYAIYAGTLEPMEDPQIVAAVNALKAA